MVRRDNVKRKITISLERSEIEKKFLSDFENGLVESLEKYNFEGKTQEKLVGERKKITDSAKKNLKKDKIIKIIKQEITEFNRTIYQKSVDFRNKHIYQIENFAELEKRIKAGEIGLFLIPFCNKLDCEKTISHRLPAYSIRCLFEKPFNSLNSDK